MINNTNLTVIQGNLTRDPDYNADLGLVTLGIAVDYAGNERDSDSKVGYFDVKMWLRENDYTAAQTVRTVKEAIDSGKLVKGAKISILGKLNQERWPREGGGTNSKVVVVAEQINILWSGDRNTDREPVGATAGAGNDGFDLNQF